MSMEQTQSIPPAESQNQLASRDQGKIGSVPTAMHDALAACLQSLSSDAAFDACTPQVSVPASRPRVTASRPVMVTSSAGPSLDSRDSLPDVQDEKFDIVKFRDLHHVALKGEGDEMFEPFYNFDVTPFTPEIKEVFKDVGYERPTPIQAQSWPIALQGRDIISVAWHGTGKTCAYLAPIYHKLVLAKKAAEEELKNLESGQEVEEDVVEIQRKYLNRLIGSGGANIEAIHKTTGCLIEVDSEDDTKPMCEVHLRGPAASLVAARQLVQDAVGDHRPKVLVLAPTDNLVEQIEEQALRYTRATQIWSLGMHVGTPRRLQLSEMRRTKPELIITTPGRCKEFIDIGGLDMSQVEYVVLDEADKMIDMGFEPLISDIISHLPADRQSFMFAARWPEEVHNLAQKFAQTPIEVDVEENEDFNANKRIKQMVRLAREDDKNLELWKALQEINFDQEDPMLMTQTIIFVNSNDQAEAIADDLFEHGLSVESLHGRHELGDAVMGHFRAGDIRTLVTTDLAARGLDVDVAAIINYDMPPPGHAEDYLRRVSHISRESKWALVYSFFTPEDLNTAPDVAEVLERAGQEVPDQMEKICTAMGIDIARNSKESQYLYDDEQSLEDFTQEQEDPLEDHKDRRSRAYQTSSNVDDAVGDPDIITRHSQRKGRAYGTDDVQETARPAGYRGYNRDWNCPGCGAHQLAADPRCKMCNTAKPGAGFNVRNEVADPSLDKTTVVSSPNTVKASTLSAWALGEEAKPLEWLVRHRSKMEDRQKRFEDSTASTEKEANVISQIVSNIDDGFHVANHDISHLKDKVGFQMPSRSTVLQHQWIEPRGERLSKSRRAFQDLLAELRTEEPRTAQATTGVQG